MDGEKLRHKYKKWQAISQSETWLDLTVELDSKETALLQKLKTAAYFSEVKQLQGQLSMLDYIRYLLRKPEEDYKFYISENQQENHQPPERTVLL